MKTTKAFISKRILLFSPQFFGYGQEIANKLESFGAEVDYFDERPGNDFVTKAIIRLNKSLLSKKIDRYYQRIISQLKKDTYHFVVFLNAEAISPQNLRLLRENQRAATFVLYMWDSLKNKKYTLDLLPHFDRKLTFDKEDSLVPQYGFHFRPLFFLDMFRDINGCDEQTVTDLLFVGTVHSDRYQLLMDVKKECGKLGKNVDFFMFFPSKKLFYAQKAANKSFKTAKISDFEFNSLGKQALIQKISKSRVVLDIQHPSQKGLTMRTIEMIGAKKKIITTNKEILDYDFYNPNNIYYMNRKNMVLESSFFETPYQDLDNDIYYKYSIEGWLEEVFWTPIAK
ncbi:hypothetical protein FK220_007070 [Flavobacteriaceae bacterium TP-CH-4]|uniref:Lipopolysaccharide biosynthesis protein n=1 Tax=Pelagihabitans pacificus TaxID=2696054 RepID=A0A967AS42_9FLAO|nr:hypothetical protein [Pelagihabitans pacificus]NHF59094.1 hypothetical protein [Pelagihabitans pacificus]